MASQQGPPTRPWFRLATMARPPAPTAPPAPTPQPDQAPAPPRPTLMRPTLTFRAPPPPPQTKSPPVTAPPPRPATTAAPAPPRSPPQEPRPISSAPRSPPLQQSAPPMSVSGSPPRAIPSSFIATMGPTNNRAVPTSSPPKIVKPLEKTPPPSPTMKPISHPPSPLTLPPPQLRSSNGSQPEYEQKTVLVQETKEKPKGLANRSSSGDLRRHIGWSAHDPKNDTTKKPETSKKQSDSEDFGMTSITIAGENKGAVMELGHFHKKKHELGNNRHSLLVKKDYPNTSSDGEKSGTDSDGNSKAKNKNQKSNPQPMKAVMNSNVQGVNNSILYNCSTTHHDPGVHFSLSRKPTNGRDHKDNVN